MDIWQGSGIMNQHKKGNEEFMGEKTKVKQLTLRMSENLHREFKITAVKQGRTMGEVTIELIKEYIKKESDPL